MRWHAVLTAVLLAAGTPVAARQPTADAYAVMDAETRRILDGRNIAKRMAPASATKILTGLIALERLPANATVKISSGASAIRVGSVVGFAAGETWSVDDLLYAMLLASANDAAFAVSERVAGSVEGFVRLMNTRAREIGATASRFSNPTGYDAADHYVTAHDLALITRRAMQDPRFRVIVGTQTHVIARPGHPTRQIVNRNTLLGAYAGADGVKTGSTGRAGQVLVGSAVRDGWRLIAVAMRSADPVADVSKMLDDGYAKFRRTRVARGGQQIQTATVARASKPLVVIVPRNVYAAVRRGATISSRIWLNPQLRAPIDAGARVGTMRFYEGTQMVAETSLVAATPVSP